MKRVIKERDFKLPSLDGGGTVATTAAANKSRLGAFDTGDEGDNYNFVQGGKKKADSVIDDLKRRIDEQRREIESKSAAIMALQRNFESLSILLRQEKTESARWRSEGESARERAERLQVEVVQLQQRLAAEGAREERLRVLEQEHSVARRSAEKAREELHEVREQLQRALREVEETRREKNESEKAVIQLEGRLRSLEDSEREVARLKRICEQLREEQQRSEDERKRLFEVTQQQKQILTELEASRERAQQELELSRKTRRETGEVEAQYLRELQERQNEVLGLQARVQKLQSEEENERARARLKEPQVEELRAAVKRKMREIEGVVQNQQGLEARLAQCVCQQFQSVLERYRSLRDKCGDEVEMLPRFELEGMRQMADSLRESLTLITGEVERVQKKLQACEQERAREQIEYRSKVQELRRQLDALEEDRNTLLQNMRSTYTEQNEARTQSETLVEKKNQTISELMQENSELKLRNERLQGDNSKVRAEREQLQQEFDLLLTKTHKLESEIEVLKDTRAQGDNALAQELKQIRERLEREIDNAQQISSAHRRVQQILRDKETEFDAQKGLFMKKIQDLEEEARRDQQSAAKISNLLEERKSDLQNEKKHVEELEQRLRQLELQNRELQNDLRAQKPLIDKKDNEILRLQLEIDKLSKKIIKMEDEITSLNPEEVRREQREIESQKKVLQGSIAKI